MTGQEAGGAGSGPTLLDRRIAARLALSEADFAQFAAHAGRRLGGRPTVAGDLEHAAGYPWQRPAHSFCLRDGSVEPLESPAQLEAMTGGDAPRHGLIAIGSNASPGVLAEKLRAAGNDRGALPALTGSLAGHDVVASAHLARYGAMPATVVASPGTSVSATLLLVTDAQFTTLTRGEFHYAVVRLPGALFTADLGAPAPPAVFAYVSRNGALAPSGEPAALAAVPAEGRRLRGWTQLELLGRAAVDVLGPAATATELVRRTIEDYAFAVEVARPVLARASDPFRPADWRLLGG
jgi:hypothetical protein